MSFSRTYEHRCRSVGVVWTAKNEGLPPFNELIVSWNGLRPQMGKWIFWVGLRTQDAWSPWLKYAEWSASSQKTFHSAPENSLAKTHQDSASPKEGFCDGYRIQVAAEEAADLSSLKTIYACASNLSAHRVDLTLENLASVMLPGVPKHSQMKLVHPRHKDLCSPTSTSTALNYLLGRRAVHPVTFAHKIHDGEWDIYGNWILNTAQAYQECGGAFRCHVERLNHFCDVHRYLLEALPVVVSIRGPIAGAPLPFSSGHLICIIGYDPKQQRVYCIDPAFPDDASTLTSYALNDFLIAWGKRGNLAYVFPRK